METDMKTYTDFSDISIPDGSLIEVFFYDIVENPEWIDEDTIIDMKCPLMKVAGYFYDIDDLFLRMMPMITTEDTQLSGGCVVIPVGCVKEIKVHV